MIKGAAWATVSIILPASGKFKGDIERAVTDGRRDQKNDAECAPPILIVKACPDDGESDDDPDNAVRFADVAFHEIVLLYSFLFGGVDGCLILLLSPLSCKPIDP